MPARIVVVHDDRDFLGSMITALQIAGYDVVGFADTMSALTALEHASQLELLITRVEYEPGQPHGIALARMARSRRPQVKVLFVALMEHEDRTAGLGEFLEMPSEPQDVVKKVIYMLD